MVCLAKQLARPLLLTTVIAAAGCSSTSPVKYSGLEATSYMKLNTAGDSRQVPFLYAVPVDWSKYHSITVEPVAIYRGSDAQFKDLPQKDRRHLADYMQAEFTLALAEKFTVNTFDRGAPALRLSLTLTGADTTPQFVGTLTKFDLAGGPYNIVQSVRGGRGLMSGYVNYVVEVKDASTGELLLAYVAEQYPNAMNIGATFGSLSAAETGVDKGAEQLLKKLHYDKKGPRKNV